MSNTFKKRPPKRHVGKQSSVILGESPGRGGEQIDGRGNAYYYFGSKEHLIQAFYDQVTDNHWVASRDVLDRETDLRARLSGVVSAAVALMEPYHRFAGSLFRSAADPHSPLSPFSPESAAARKKGIALFAEVLDGSSARVPADLRAELPELLWLYQMGVILFWIHDRSPGHRRTDRVIAHSSDLVARAIALASFPVLRPLRRTALHLLADLRA